MKTNRALLCPRSADYSQVAGNVILPFVFALDLERSILTPSAEENQRFCYTVTANGEDSSAYADLSHFVLGICESVTADQLGEITVVRDGVPQRVVLGENVELKTVARPDPTTGCAGLKFDFGLNKVSGVMSVCFELLTPYPVGAVRVCVKGGTTALNNLFVCGPACEEPQQTCATTAYQRARVCVPVTITPWAYAG
ncbi:MAG: hypothetical protein PHY12_14550, partial [Eubacteriales bacterium]|nr:hypothetical protein [Eubacteriales bacterium]